MQEKCSDRRYRGFACAMPATPTCDPTPSGVWTRPLFMGGWDHMDYFYSQGERVYILQSVTNDHHRCCHRLKKG